MQKNVPMLRTPGVIAHELGEPLHRILYVLQTRRFITPSARAGRFRLYGREAVVLIRQELDAMDVRQEEESLHDQGGDEGGNR